MKIMQFDPSLYKQLLDHVHDGVYFVDINRQILYWNKGAERITGYAANEVIGSSCADNILVHIDEHGEELCHGFCPMLMAMGEARERHAEVFFHHRDGHRVPVSVQVTPLRDEKGELIGCLETFRESVAGPDPLYIHDLEKASLLDPLTHVANRRYLEMKLASALEEFRRYDVPFGIIFSDIDHFKAINDTHGHLVGDDVLRMAAQALSKNIRTTDFVGRWGGEEFLIIASHVSIQNLQKLSNKLRAMIEKSFLSTRDMFIRVTMTFGVTLVRPDDSEHTLLQRADRLMYRGKAAGRNRVEIDP